MCLANDAIDAILMCFCFLISFQTFQLMDLVMVLFATQTPFAEARLLTTRDSVGVIMVGEATGLTVLVS